MQIFGQFEVVYHVLNKAIHLNHLNRVFQVRRLATLKQHASRSACCFVIIMTAVLRVKYMDQTTAIETHDS